jgi:hypothetical protein
MEPALIDKFKCFPNMMPHASADSMRMFIKDGIRGIFICGQQDMLESYIIAKIWDDPSQDVDAMMNEFFARYFGASAKPMGKFYRELEAIATTPENYKKPCYRRNGIDWKNVAWSQLGTESRMRKLGRWIAQAEASAATDREKERVALWNTGLWKWMEEGRADYVAKQAAKKGKQ